MTLYNGKTEVQRRAAQPAKWIPGRNTRHTNQAQCRVCVVCHTLFIYTENMCCLWCTAHIAKTQHKHIRVLYQRRDVQLLYSERGQKSQYSTHIIRISFMNKKYMAFEMSKIIHKSRFETYSNVYFALYLIGAHSLPYRIRVKMTASLSKSYRNFVYLD